jgi:hypothetical protein
MQCRLQDSLAAGRVLIKATVAVIKVIKNTWTFILRLFYYFSINDNGKI